MDICDEVIARNGIQIVIIQLTKSIDEIKLNNANRLDLITSMDESRQKLIHSLTIFDQLRTELREVKYHASSWMIHAKLKDSEIEKLKEKNNEIMKLL